MALATRTIARMQQNMKNKKFIPVSSSRDLDHGLEDGRRNRHPRGFETFVEFRANAGGAEAAGNASAFVDTGFFEYEDVLHGHQLALHADALGDSGYTAGPVAHARDLNEKVGGGADLLANGADTHVGVGHAAHDFQTADGIAGRVGVDGGKRAVVAGVHSL